MREEKPLSKENLIRVLDFINEDERSELEKLAYSYKESGVLIPNPAGPRRYAAKVYGTQYCTQLITDLGDRISARLGLGNYSVDNYLGYTISLIQPGGFINEHIDYYGIYRNGLKHMRCNIMVRRENESYDPVISRMVVPVPEKAAWAFFASDNKHGTQDISGNGERIIYGFGWAVPLEYSFENYQS